MNKLLALPTALSAVILFMMSDLSIAHQLQHATTSVDFKSNHTIEVAHRFYVHDAEAVVASLLDKHQDLLQSEQAQKALCDYVNDQFRLRYKEGEPVALRKVGCEIEGKYFWAYQEAAYEYLPRAIDVKFEAFQEEIPKQVNLINFRIYQQVQSLELKADDKWKTLKLTTTE